MRSGRHRKQAPNQGGQINSRSQSSPTAGGGLRAPGCHTSERRVGRRRAAPGGCNRKRAGGRYARARYRSSPARPLGVGTLGSAGGWQREQWSLEPGEDHTWREKRRSPRESSAGSDAGTAVTSPPAGGGPSAASALWHSSSGFSRRPVHVGPPAAHGGAQNPTFLMV